jgi:ADP-L-glycero-D-manno-heptose 6-epimerase
MKTVLLTGHLGFIGKNLYTSLTRSGYNVLGIEKDFYNNKNWKSHLYNTVKQSDYILHVGAISDTTLQDSKEMFFYNYTVTKLLIEYADVLGVKVIYSSSAANYGLGDGVPNNVYGWSKLTAEDYGLKSNTQFIALRYFNVYGPGEQEKGKMSSIAYQSYGKKDFKLFPTDVKSIRRDFIYVDDVVEANIRAMDWDITDGCYDVGTAEPETFENLVKGMGVNYSYHPASKIPDWYQYFTCADKSKWLPGWEPKYNVASGTEKYKFYLDAKDTN